MRHFLLSIVKEKTRVLMSNRSLLSKHKCFPLKIDMLNVNNTLLSIVKYINDSTNYLHVLRDVEVSGFFLIRTRLKKD